MQNTLSIVQLVITALLIVAILLQRRGSQLGGAFGGGGEIYYKKRGVEKIVFIATVVLSVIFILTALIRMLI